MRAWALGLFVALAGIAVLVVLDRALVVVHTAVATLLLGAVLAFLLEPVAGVLDHLFRARWVSAAVLLVIIGGGLAVGVGYLGVAAFREAQGLAATLPQLIASAQQEFPSWLSMAQRLAGNFNLISIGQTLLSHFEALGKGALSYSLVFLSHTTAMLTTLIVALVIAFYFILDGRRMRAGLHALLPRDWLPGVTTVERVVREVFGGYVRGQLIVAAVFGLLIGGGMWKLGVPYPLLLGLQAALFEMLPTVGPILAAVAPAVLALSLPYPHVWYVLIYFLVAQQLESNLLVPRISGNAVGLHPVAVILAILAGFDAAGLVGALAAVPVAGTAFALLKHFLAEPDHDRGRRPSPSGPGRTLPRRR